MSIARLPGLVPSQTHRVLEPTEAGDSDPAVLETIYAQAPRGAMLVAGIATGLVFALWFAFYLLVFIPRGSLR